MKKIFVIFWLAVCVLAFCVYLLILAKPQSCNAKLHTEKHYVAAWCNARQGKTEVRLKDGTRVDCLTDTYAIEFDFAKKWAESIGQSLHYARLTGKKPGIVLICRKEKDRRHLERLRKAVEFGGLKIEIFSIGSGNDTTRL